MISPNGKRADRRTFLGQSVALAAPVVASSAVLGQAKPSDPIRVGLVGLGSRGFNLLDEIFRSPDAVITAICDVDAFHYRDRPWGRGKAYGRRAATEAIEAHYQKQSRSEAARPQLTVTDDFREVAENDRVDAVIVATPDHWHALCTLAALRAGKDVYCEKPVTHTFAEGLLVCKEVEARNAVFQTGSQQRSDPLFRRAVEIVRNGHIGQVKRMEIGLPPGYDTPQGDETVAAPPDHLDYDRWCGPAEKLSYMRARHHRWWRGHRAFGGGVLMDWIGHHNDIAHWALELDSGGPLRVEAVGWTQPKTSIYNTPHQYTIRCEYEGGVVSTISSRNQVGAKLIGDNGWVHVRRGKLTASDPRWTDTGYSLGDIRVYRSPGHMRNFLDSARDRSECVAPASAAHRSITPGHLGYVSQQLGRALRWDASRQVVVDDVEANKLLRLVHYRSPWKLDG